MWGYAAQSALPVVETVLPAVPSLATSACNAVLSTTGLSLAAGTLALGTAGEGYRRRNKSTQASTAGDTTPEASSGAPSAATGWRRPWWGASKAESPTVDKTETVIPVVTEAPVLTDLSKKSQSPSSRPTFLSRMTTGICNNPIKVGLSLAAAATLAGSLYCARDQLPSVFSSATVDPSYSSYGGGGGESGIQSVFGKFARSVFPGDRAH